MPPVPAQDRMQLCDRAKNCLALSAVEPSWETGAQQNAEIAVAQGRGRGGAGVVMMAFVPPIL